MLAKRSRVFWADWAWSLAGAAPFLSVYAVHFLSLGARATGFVQLDQPYYAAIGRDFFTRGDILGASNPYDPGSAAPVIYHQWFPWLLGFAVKVLGLDPGYFYAVLGVLLAVVCARLTMALVEARLEGRPDHRRLLFLLTMWGGGALTLGAFLGHLGGGWRQPFAFDPMSLDPMDGQWFLNWGRNLLFTTEALYHALTAAFWLAVLRRRWTFALVLAALIAQTHPWTGLPALLILAVWSAARYRREPAALSASFLAATLGTLALCLWYHMIYLNGFEAHRLMAARWEIAWTAPLSSLALAYLPAAAAALVEAYRRRGRLDEFGRFLAVCFLTTFLLSKHEWFMRPHQPLHFTRGYSWLALCLLGLPACDDALGRLRRRVPSARARTAALLVVGALLVLDNAVFLARNARSAYASFSPLWMTEQDRDLFAQMRRTRLRGVFLSESYHMCYLSAVYTDVRPYLGHWILTPDFQQRRAQAVAWLRKGEAGAWLDSVDLVAVGPDRVPAALLAAPWRLALSNGRWRLYERARP